MESGPVQCRICEEEIPRRRLEVMPNTEVCVRCSEKIGGEHVLEVTISGTAKAGSLKITGQEVNVKLKQRRVR